MWLTDVGTLYMGLEPISILEGPFCCSCYQSGGFQIRTLVNFNVLYFLLWIQKINLEVDLDLTSTSSHAQSPKKMWKFIHQDVSNHNVVRCISSAYLVHMEGDE